jgi:hypothetical protein
MGTANSTPKTTQKQVDMAPSECPMDKGQAKTNTDINANLYPSECPMHQGQAKTDINANSYPSECPMHQGQVKSSTEEVKSFPSECPMHQEQNSQTGLQDDIDPTNMVILILYDYNIFVKQQIRINIYIVIHIDKAEYYIYIYYTDLSNHKKLLPQNAKTILNKKCVHHKICPSI